MPTNHQYPTFSYRALTWLLFPGAFIFTTFTAIKYRNFRYWRQRLTIYFGENKCSSSIWCHCASVGEINTALPLLKLLVEKNHTLVVTTNTITGYTTIHNAQLKNTSILYLPVDVGWFATRFFNLVSPAVGLLIETELWPSMVLTAQRRNIPIAIVNGRISTKTLNAPPFLQKNYQRILSHINIIFTSSDENTQRFVQLGAPSDRIQNLDNLKFCLPTTKPAQIVPPLDFPYLLCASTHADEEKQIITQWQLQKPKNLGLVIAVRHPHRANEVSAEIERAGLNVVRHSAKPTHSKMNDVYLIDTLGELMPFMAHATLVFMGGSLVPVGGHNILEAANVGKCVLVGPNHDNFSQIVKALIQQNGIIIVNNAQELLTRVIELIDDDSRRQQLGKAAQNFALSKQHILTQYMQELEKFISAYSEYPSSNN